MIVTRSLPFTLPSDLEAKVPPEARGLRRDEVRMLVTFREKDGVTHATFRDLPAFLRAGDLLVVNDSGTLPAALTATREDGTQIALHLSQRLPAGLWTVEPRHTQAHSGEPLLPSIDVPRLRRPNAPIESRSGERVSLPGGASATLLSPYPQSSRLWVASLDLPATIETYLAQHGRPISYGYVEGQWPIEAYQTIFARHPGSAEMPSAARPFTPEVVAALERKGVHLATITLHTGVASLERHERPYEEWFHVPAATAAALRETIDSGSRVIAVGTTVVRALESAVDESGRPIAMRGWTDLVITPERGVRTVHGLLTGFHEPEATHLDMLEAIAGRAHIRRAYRAALEGRYLWHEFGDVHLIL
jgi:S-adenosylmethionine:tRNA ribosyltransferase-isomerase